MPHLVFFRRIIVIRYKKTSGPFGALAGGMLFRFWIAWGIGLQFPIAIEGIRDLLAVVSFHGEACRNESRRTEPPFQMPPGEIANSFRNEYCFSFLLDCTGSVIPFSPGGDDHVAGTPRIFHSLFLHDGLLEILGAGVNPLDGHREGDRPPARGEYHAKRIRRFLWPLDDYPELNSESFRMELPPNLNGEMLQIDISVLSSAKDSPHDLFQIFRCFSTRTRCRCSPQFQFPLNAHGYSSLGLVGLKGAISNNRYSQISRKMSIVAYLV